MAVLRDTSVNPASSISDHTVKLCSHFPWMEAVWLGLGNKMWTKWLYVTSTFNSWYAQHQLSFLSLLAIEEDAAVIILGHWASIRTKPLSNTRNHPWLMLLTTPSYNQSGLMLPRNHSRESVIWPRCGTILCSSPTLWKWNPKVWNYCGLCYQISM